MPINFRNTLPRIKPSDTTGEVLNIDPTADNGLDWDSVTGLVPTGTYASVQTPGTAMIAEERAFNKVAAVPNATDDTSGLLSLLTANPNVILRSGTYKVQANQLVGADRSTIYGAGLNKTIIQRIGAGTGSVLKPGSFNSRLDGFTIDGLNVAGTTGILCDNSNPQNSANWGAVHVRNCPIAGVKFHQPNGGSGHFYNHITGIWTDGCGKGLWFETDIGAASALINANQFDFVRCNSCTTGFQVDGADGNGVSFLEAEICTTGVVVTRAEVLNISAGWLEGNTNNFAISDAPAVQGFWYGGITDEDFPASYNEATGRSDLISFKAGGQFKALASRWWFDNLQVRPGSQGIVRANQLLPPSAGTGNIGETAARWGEINSLLARITNDATVGRVITDAVSGSGQAGVRFGNVVAGAVTPDAGNYWEVEVGGVLKKVIIAS